MGGTTPARIKQKVIKYWLSGLTRDEIANKLGISEGNVSSVIQQGKNDIPDMDLLRELAVKLKKEDYNLNSFASAYRQRVMLQKRRLNDEQIDDMIEHVDEHCYKRGIEMETFVDQIDKKSHFSEKYSCPIDKLDELIIQKEDEVTDLCLELVSINSKIKASKDAELAAYLTEQNISDFKQKELLPLTKRQLEDKLALTYKRLIDLKRIYTMREMTGMCLKINSIPDGMTSEDVIRACFLLGRNASHFGTTIETINKQEPSLPFKVGPIPDITEDLIIIDDIISL